VPNPFSAHHPERHKHPDHIALLAQLVEQLTLNQRVEGSSPSGGIPKRSRGVRTGLEWVRLNGPRDGPKPRSRPRNRRGKHTKLSSTPPPTSAPPQAPASPRSDAGRISLILTRPVARAAPPPPSTSDTPAWFHGERVGHHLNQTKTPAATRATGVEEPSGPRGHDAAMRTGDGVSPAIALASVSS
jgi:hypothetical protein